MKDGYYLYDTHTHIGHARHSLQAGLDDAVDQIVDLQGIQGVARKGQPNDRERIGFHFGNHRLVNGLWQTAAHP